MVAVVVPAVLVVGLPLVVGLQQVIRSGCSFDRAAFDQVVAKLPAPPTDSEAYDPVDAPSKIGSCRILGSYGVTGGYIFYGENPGFDDSGWGYFPAGPNDDLGNSAWEAPQFEQIEGSWYTWTASW
ncbi:hypothetical protein [Micromonospora sp. NPDC047740]|uniref:hypothetical protein n=1 Tax=Micromonospora sp. NPDC047740 TaxID=3364254 RepID=UPI00371E5CF2